MNKKKTLNTLLAGVVAVGALGAASSAYAIPADSEKCYGVVKAGMNGCGAADKSHGCAGMAKEDASGVEWLALPKGTCEKLSAGSLEPIMGDSDDGGDDHGDDHGAHDDSGDDASHEEMHKEKTAH